MAATVHIHHRHLLLLLSPKAPLILILRPTEGGRLSRTFDAWSLNGTDSTYSGPLHLPPLKVYKKNYQKKQPGIERVQAVADILRLALLS